VIEMTFARSLIAGAILAGCFAGPVYAQQKDLKDKEPAQLEEEARRRDAVDVDKQYKATMQRTHRGPATETRANDPWSNMRGADDSKTKR
jgi:hypothetical protein